MKLRVLMAAVVFTMLFLITGILYAANGDLIVNGDMTVKGNATVNGTLNVGAGGVKYPDGSTQTTATSPTAAISPTTQNDVTSSRALGTVYRNTTGRPMFCAVVINTSTVGRDIYAYTDNNASPTTLVCQSQISNLYSSAPHTLFFIVLPNNYYKVTVSGTSTTLIKWTEWY